MFNDQNFTFLYLCGKSQRAWNVRGVYSEAETIHLCSDWCLCCSYFFYFRSFFIFLFFFFNFVIMHYHTRKQKKNKNYQR